MEHNMKLYEKYFNMIRSGNKVIEIRLNDEKRRLIKIGDTIVFSKLPDCMEQEGRYGVLGIRIMLVD